MRDSGSERREDVVGGREDRGFGGIAQSFPAGYRYLGKRATNVNVQWRPTRFPKSDHERCSGGLRKPSGGGYGAEEMGIPYFKARGRYGLELVGEVA